MNYIDAIEGTVCSILQRIHQGYLDGAADDSEFIRNVKQILQGVQEFIAAHPELMILPDVVHKVLYEYAKRLWLDRPAGEVVQQAADSHPTSDDVEPTAYRHYYFDYIYTHGDYPR